jgi:hypothetical protein
MTKQYTSLCDVVAERVALGESLDEFSDLVK